MEGEGGFEDLCGLSEGVEASSGRGDCGLPLSDFDMARGSWWRCWWLCWVCDVARTVVVRSDSTRSRVL